MNPVASPDPTPVGLLDALTRQAGWCAGGGNAPFTAAVMRASHDWLASDDAARRYFESLASDPLAAAVPLRWAAALHHLALRGIEPFAALWPPRDGGDPAALRSAVQQGWSAHRVAVKRALAHPPQTNEVQRSAALLPGLLHIAAATGRPIRLLEIGASAGLNLWCDRYRHEHAGPPQGRIPECAARRASGPHSAWSWGDAAAPLVIGGEWRGPAPPLDAPLAIEHRAGCDAMPVDLLDPAEGLRLASFVWPDQPERLARLRAAQQAAARWLAGSGVRVEALPAAAFVERELSLEAPGQTRVLMHSVVWQYIAAAEQRAITATVAAAGAKATAASPLAWLRFEPVDAALDFQLRCTLWPGGNDTLLARMHPHGAWVEWLAASDGAA